jgi:hypothetical protein
MTAHLRIERLVITGLAPGQPALALRDELERALSSLLSRPVIERLRVRSLPAKMPTIEVGPPPPGQTVAMQIALAIRDALVPAEDTPR